MSVYTSLFPLTDHTRDLKLVLVPLCVRQQRRDVEHNLETAPTSIEAVLPFLVHCKESKRIRFGWSLVSLMRHLHTVSRPPLYPLQPSRVIFSPMHSRNSWKSTEPVSKKGKGWDVNDDVIILRTVIEKFAFSCLSFSGKHNANVKAERFLRKKSLLIDDEWWRHQ